MWLLVKVQIWTEMADMIYWKNWAEVAVKRESDPFYLIDNATGWIAVAMSHSKHFDC